MPSAVNTLGLRGLARRIAAGQLKTDDKARHEELGELIHLYAQNLGDEGQLAWLKAEVPALQAWLDAVPVTTLSRASTDPAELTRLVADLEQKLEGKLAERKGWIAEGLSPAYEDQARRLHNDKGHQFLQQIDGQTRFTMPELAYRPLVSAPEDRDFFDRLTNRELKDDLLQKLMGLGVDPSEIDVGEKITVRTWARDIDELHVPPLDAALLFDDAALGERGKQLAQTSKAEVRRVGHRDKDVANVFRMGAEDFMGMRGVAYGLSATASADEIADKCKLRLQERGVDRPELRLIDVDGKATIELPTVHARVLLAPIADGDPATKLSIKPMDRHDPRKEGYDPETGVFLTQCAMLAYEDQKDLESVGKLWGLSETQLFDDKATDAQGFVAYDKAKNAIVVSFRGTESKADALIDADFRQRDASRYGTGEIHAGFKEQMDALYDDVMAKVKDLLADAPDDPAPTVMLAGHSLGGALAGLFAGAAVDEGIPVGAIYTAGQPKLGDGDFTADLSARLDKAGARYFRYVNNADIVTQVPPGWDHGGVGKEVYIDRLGKAHPPDSQDYWDRLGDRAAAAGLNLLSGETFDSGPDAFSDHRCHFYVGFVRKNRNEDFS
jgi:triacylglycerol lipase